ncbi:MAG: PDZ domain-containing protein [Planctomycetaceae bacterium]|nr:PDZ domain-containing protein [Planctomycetaceae bacterium]
MLALMLISLLQTAEPKPDLENTKLLIFDSARGYMLQVWNSGRVDLTVKEDDKDGKKVSRVYFASSAEDFRAHHPELVKKYDLEKPLGLKPKAGVSQDEFDEWWNKLKKGTPGLGPVPGLDQPFDEDLQRFLEEQRELFGRLRRPLLQRTPETAPRQAPQPGGREFGVRVEAVSEILRDQLSLKENEGVLVAEVRPGSVAEKAGVKEHDILLKLEGKPVGDRFQFRADVLTSLGKPEFSLELLRAGKRETIQVKTGMKKDE